MEKDPKSIPSRFADYLHEIKESGSTIAWIWRELLGEDGRRLAKRMSLLLTFSVLLLSLQPLAFSWIINGVRDANLQIILVGGALLASAAMTQHGIALVQHLTRESTINRFMYHMQSRLNELFYEKTLGQHSGEDSPLDYSSIERAKNRVQQVEEMVLFESSSVFAQVLFAFVLLWTLKWQIGLLATVMVASHMYWSLRLNYRVAKETIDIERAFRRHGRQLIERWEKIVRVKTCGKSRSEHLRLVTWFDEILQQDKRFWFWFIRQAACRDIVSLVVRLSVIAYGASLVYSHVWQVGMIVPLYAWMTDLTNNLGYIGNAERRINQQMPYVRAMRDALSVKPSFDEYKGKKLTNASPIQVRFDHVGLAYSEGGKAPYQILRDISFTICPGEKVALIGPSGAGKTSIMKLALRYMDPTSGSVWVNGSKLQDLELASWMERVGYIPQQPQVFDGTMRYNLTFGLSEERKKTITDQEIWEVMRLLQIDFGERLTDGLETRVGRDGMKLSGGQSQRLMIGAAVIKKPIFMVIDEATSSLDSTTEKLVQQGLETVLAGSSVGALIVAHRLSSVRDICNRFIVLRPLEEVKEGQSQIEAEADSFEKLYQISPTFRRLATDQHLLLRAAA